MNIFIVLGVSLFIAAIFLLGLSWLDPTLDQWAGIAGVFLVILGGACVVFLIWGQRSLL